MSQAKPIPLAYKQADAARVLGVSLATFRRWENRGLVKGQKIGGLKLYRRTDLEQLIGTCAADAVRAAQ